MKVAQICPYVAPAKDSMGAERMIEALARGLDEAGHEVVMKVDSRSTYTPVPSVDEIPKDCDILHFHGWDHKTSREEYDSYGIPWVVTMHGGGSESHPEWLKTVRSNPNMICVSKFISDRLKCPSYVWAGSHPNDFQYSDTKENYFLWMAGTDWGEGKGLFSTIAMAKKTNINLKIAGTGQNKHIIKDLKTWCNDKVQYIGAVNGAEKTKLLSKAKRVFLLTNLPDACPLTVSESMFSGTPIIASSNGAMPELIENKKTGFVCSSFPEVAKAIMILNNKNCLDMYQNCREKAHNEFSHIVMAKKYLQYYQNMINYGNTQGV